MKRVNDWLAERMSEWLSQMWFFWLLTVLILSTLLFQRPSGIQGWALFFVSVFFQGVALVVINYTSDKTGRTTMRVLQETHDATLEELATVKAELSEMKSIHTEVHELLKEGQNVQTSRRT